MFILSLLYILLCVLVGYFVLTQIAIPIYRGTPWFPWLEDERKLRAKHREVRQDVVEEKIRYGTAKTKQERREVKDATREITSTQKGR